MKRLWTWTLIACFCLFIPSAVWGAKISELPALTTVATGDITPIVDISEPVANERTKRITWGELMAAPGAIGGTTPAAGSFTSLKGTTLGIGTTTPNTAIDIQGGQTVNITTVNAATYDLLVTDYILHVTYTPTGAVTSLTLPTAQCVSGRTILIKDAGGNAGTNNITIDTQGSETIDGAAIYTLNTDYEAISLYSDGSNWFAN